VVAQQRGQPNKDNLAAARRAGVPWGTSPFLPLEVAQLPGLDAKTSLFHRFRQYGVNISTFVDPDPTESNNRLPSGENTTSHCRVSTTYRHILSYSRLVSFDFDDQKSTQRTTSYSPVGFPAPS
jgi:hypothetical protein